MWIDAEGGTHTVALPDPGSVIAPGLRRLLSAAGHAQRDRVATVLMEQMDAVWEDVEARELRSVGTAGEPFPSGMLVGATTTADDATASEAAAAAVDALPEEFRLDGIEILLDFLTEQHDRSPRGRLAAARRAARTAVSAAFTHVSARRRLRFAYDGGADAAYIGLRPRDRSRAPLQVVVDDERLRGTVVLDLDAHQNLVGIELVGWTDLVGPDDGATRADDPR
ncbi:uncharacterized protein YuzE [Isoptericola jiangsuensis]|uniref:Uncharacterized protein YuzE n=1 Tax=Isoptericola jiangsuensis TaxID=548579 RepID=A0A2A9EW01_9MICO|nr:DUF2283 domain-containing protein [Isoptericola jiangsuensis]PFG42691.1 uncharacterized protein YuzE [Isoptericola jiangsuensis]